MDTVPAIAGYCRTISKHGCGFGEYCHAVTAAPADGAAIQSQRGRDRQNTSPVVEKAGIGSYEVSIVDDDSLSNIALKDVISAEHLRTIVDRGTATAIVLDHIAFQKGMGTTT